MLAQQRKWLKISTIALFWFIFALGWYYIIFDYNRLGWFDPSLFIALLFIPPFTIELWLRKKYKTTTPKSKNSIIRARCGTQVCNYTFL